MSARRIIEATWGATKEPEFRQWFGDWDDPKKFTSRAKGPVSHVVDKSGSPQRVYHSTRHNFDQFATARPSKNSWALGSWDTTRHAIFFTDDVAFSNEYVKDGDTGYQSGARTIPAFLNMKSPVDFRRRDAWDVAEEVGINPRWTQGKDVWALFDDEEGKMFVDALKREGYDGAIFGENDENRETKTTYAVFDPSQVRW